MKHKNIFVHEMQDKWCFCVVIKACINHNWFFGSTAIYILLPQRDGSVVELCEGKENIVTLVSYAT